MRIFTTDTFCGAYLLAQGAHLVDLLVDRSGVQQSGTFVFEGEDVLVHHEAYSRGQAVASVKAIREGVTRLRSELARALRPHRRSPGPPHPRP